MLHLNRREWLRNRALGFGLLAAQSLLADEAPSPLAPKKSHFEAKAKRVLFLFMKGGPSQVDTFDYKPLLQRDDGKPLPFAKPRVQFAPTNNLLGSPWKFKQHGDSGSFVSELFPEVARHVDRLCFLHAVHGTNAAHGGALLRLHTGSDSQVRPSLGAWVTYGLGTENRSLPGFVTICPTLAHGGVNNWGAAFLPAEFQGTPLGHAGIPVERAVVKYLSHAERPAEIERVLLDGLASTNRRGDQPGPLDARISNLELAFRMQGELPRVQDISGESGPTRRLYGLDDPITAPFGTQCLLARRFLEAGVRFVQVSHSDAAVQWDQHAELKRDHAKNAREVDRPIGGLLTDLAARGLLKDTLVIWGGEFGRTPTAQGKDGRDHNPEGFTIWFAGDCVKGGHHHGATDDYGYYATEGKVHLHDLHATILHLLGLDHEKLTYRHGGRDYRLTDVAGQVVKEVMA